ncbi:MAG: MtrB/PioB family decaheme-associated outer membrane protein [Candidatus Limnocylindria bacterium]
MLLLFPLAAIGLLGGSAAWAEEAADPAQAAEAADEAEAADDGDEAKEAQALRALTTQASEIELGFLYNHVHGEPSAFAQYRGLSNDQFYVLGNLDIFRRAPWDGDSTQYYRLRGLNLGLDSRSIDAEYGHQGSFGFSFLFDELPVYKTQSAQTFFVDAGTANLTLPAGWVAGGRADLPIPGDTGYPTAFQTSIQDNLHETNIGWKRRKIGSGFSMVLPADLELAANYSYETKKGDKLLGSTFGLNGGNPRAVIIPERIDYHTQQIDAGLRYGGEHLQLALEYFGSGFDEGEFSQTWLNPYTAVAAWDPSAGFQGPPAGVLAECVGVPNCGRGQRAQPPDNWFNQIVASGGYDLPYNSRVTLRSAFGWSTQDEEYLPYSINPLLTVTTPLPRNSLDGEIFTSVVDFAIASRPLEKLRLDTGYRFERRDNDTPQDLYIYIPNDSADQGTAADGTARYNLPYSLTRHEVNFDAGYSLPYRSEVALGYEWELTDRDYQEVDELQTNTLSVRLNSRPAKFVSTRFNYEHSWRDGSDYNGSNPLVKSHTSQFLDDELADFAVPTSSCALAGLTPEQCLFENHPLLRKYYQANLHRDKIGAIVTLLPREDLTVTLNTNWWNDNYDDSELGMKSVEHLSPGVDVSYMLNDRVSTYSFYTYERTVSDSAGWEWGNVQQALDPTRRWWSKEKVNTHTAGAGVNLAIIRDRLELGVDYLFAQSKGAIDTVRNPGTTLPIPVPFPDLLERQHNVSVHADYHFTDNFSVRVGYLFQYLNTNDWALDGLTPTSLTCSGNACVIGVGQDSPHYTANVVSWSLVYTFW